MTAPSPTPRPACTPISWGVDTLWVCWRGTVKPAFVAACDEAQRCSADRERNGQALAAVELCGQQWAVRSQSVDAWRFYLEGPDGTCDLTCVHRRHTNKADVRLRIGSAACWVFGPAGLVEFCAQLRSELMLADAEGVFAPPPEDVGYERSDEELERAAIQNEPVASHLATAAARNKAARERRPPPAEYVQRIDICCDYQDYLPKASDQDLYVGRFRKDKQRTRSANEVAEFSSTEVTCHRKNRIFTGFEFGHAPLKTNQYRKDVEIKTSSKQWFYEIWSKHPQFDAALPVWRLECQIWRDVLAKVQRSGAWLETIRDTMACVGDFWRYVTDDWLRLVVDSRGEQKRHRRTDGRWQVLQAIDWRLPPSLVTREHQREAELQALLPQLVGLVVHAAALVSPASRPREWSDMAPLLSPTVAEYLEERGTSIKALLVKRLGEEMGGPDEALPF